ncbi:MAG: ZIP family metal transporter [Bacteroidales bacterium]|nr:ZIP family metal transporter [Bacteroidales bacterium]
MNFDFFAMLAALIVISAGSVSLAGLILFLPEKTLHKVSTYLTYLAGGTLLGASMLGMIPNAMHEISPRLAMGVTMSGILFFFVLEKVILWRTCNNEDCHRHDHAAVPIILIGDAFHNAIDGVVVAASFLTSPALGIFAALSVVLHEVPQELGDFGILIKGGLKKGKALLYNILSSTTSIIAGVFAWFMLDSMQELIPYALCFAASSFLYIALADLIPEMHRKTSAKESVIQFAFILTGILMITLMLHDH